MLTSVKKLGIWMDHSNLMELKKFQSKLEELQGAETNHSKYLSFGVNLIQNLRFYYENASLINKQKLIGSIFPENLIIENGECRITRENDPCFRWF